MFLAVDASIPWKGLLLAYGAGQLAANLPITPGGLGVVEGSITIALVAFGGSQNSTFDAVLMYRVISFWLVLVVGWLFWGQLAYQVRKGRWTRHALHVPMRRNSRGDAGERPTGRRTRRGRAGGRAMTDSTQCGRSAWRRGLGVIVGCLLAAGTVADCTTARSDLGTSVSSCYHALPAATKAVDRHGHLLGVLQLTVGTLQREAPGLYMDLSAHPQRAKRSAWSVSAGHLTPPPSPIPGVSSRGVWPLSCRRRRTTIHWAR